MKWVILVFLALILAFTTTRAEANTTCSVTGITALAFGNVDPTGTFVDTTATLSYSCTYAGVLGSLYGTYITMCASLGTDDLGNLAPRTMVNAFPDRMLYQVYKDAGRTSIWGTLGNATYAPLVINRSLGILSNGATLTGNVTIYGRVAATQGTLSPGAYTGTLANSSLTYSFNEALLTLGAPPAACDAGGTAAPRTVAAPTLSATASVVALCTFGTATDLNFGSVSGLLRTATDQTTLLRIKCTNRAAYQLGLDNGQNASGAIRRMAAGTQRVTYELYRDSQRTARWGTAIGTDTQPGTGTGVEVTQTVYGRVPAQAAVAPGSYSDIITVTVTY